MFLEEIVHQISQQADVRVGVGVLVEYPHSRPRQKVLGTLLGKWGRQHTAPYNMRKASVVLLVERQQHGTTTLLSVVQIHWKRWWRVRFANRSIDGCGFVHQDEKIQICELQDEGQCTGGQIFDFYVLDSSGQTLDVFDLMAYAEALRGSLINCGFDPEDLKFLATCDDLEWLARRYPSNVPKLLKQKVISIQQDEAEVEIDNIMNEINRLKSELKSRGNDLLEAKDRLRPRWRYLKNFLGRPLIGEVASVGKLTAALISVGFVFGISNAFGNSAFTDVSISAGAVLLAGIVIRAFRYYRAFSKWIDKFFTKYSCIEESRDRQTEEHYQNP